MIKHLLNNETRELYQEPPKIETYGKDTMPSPNFEHQMDILYLPVDKTTKKPLKYLLLVVDPYNGLCDGHALVDLKMETVIHAVEDLYDNAMYLMKPRCIKTDNEFNNTEWKEWCDEKGIKYIFANKGRHRELASINRLCQIIGKWIWELQVNEEIKSGHVYTNWVPWYKELIEILNKKNMKKLNDEYVLKKPPKVLDKPIIDDNNKTILMPDTKVRVMIPKDKPEDVRGKKQQGHMRSADIKFKNKVDEVEAPVLIPNNPPLYKLKHEKGLHHREELFVTKN